MVLAAPEKASDLRKRRYSGVMDSVTWAQQAVTALMSAGVQQAVVCPGSRSAPLAYALAAAARAFRIRLHVRTDERSAAFLALGLALPEGTPAAIVTTSGTAVANLVPAVWEARHSAVPLVVITADRPEQLRTSWANQTTALQRNAFGDAVRFHWAGDAADSEPEPIIANAVAASQGSDGGVMGPVHVNVGFREPLLPQKPWRPGKVTRKNTTSTTFPVSGQVAVDMTPASVVVAGAGAGIAAHDFADRAGAPLLAEPTSLAHYGFPAIPAYPFVVAESGLTANVEQVVVFGRPTLTRGVRRLIENAALVQVAPHDEPGPTGHRRYRRITSLPKVENSSPKEWLTSWRDAGVRADECVVETLRKLPHLVAISAAREVALATYGKQRLFVGASNAIRAVECAPPDAFRPRLISASRGLAGIDGTLATGLGVAAASYAPTRILLGDLAFFHDLGALGVPKGERGDQPVQIVVLNDQGGGIFSLLEYGDPGLPQELQQDGERVTGTPTTIDVRAACQTYGVAHCVVRDADTLADVLADPAAGVTVVEVPYGRENARAESEELHSAVREALSYSPFAGRLF